MKKIYKCYPTGWYNPTLENFWETSFYSTWKYYDYIWREEIFKNAEVLILWYPEELEYWKYIPNRYFWKIKNMWIVELKYLKESDEIVIIGFEKILRWKTLNEEEISRLKKCLYKQCYYQNQQDTWSTNNFYLYVEVYKPILQEPNMILKQKNLYDIGYCFDEKWDLCDETIKNKRFFKIYENIYYDLEKWIFIKNREEIIFSPYNSEKKQKFLEILIKSEFSKISKEKLLEVLEIDNKTLLNLKRSLLTFEFWKYLWLEKDFVEKNILIAEKNKWYMIVWEFFDKYD